jgi:hypothetical protein
MLKKPGSMRKDAILHVVTPVSNPVRYHSRYRLYRQFEQHMLANPNVRLITVELAFGDRAFEVTEAGNPRHVQLRTDDELWHKENMVNLGISRLPADWEYAAWIDADIQFVNPHWAAETIHQLQHHKVVQLFQDAIDLGPTGNVLQAHKGFAWSYVSGAKPSYVSGKYPFWHPGYAWAATKEAIDAMGGLIDWAILGAADHHMALAWIGEAKRSMPGGMSQSYRDGIMLFQDRCERHIGRDIGFVEGTILHGWHGRKVDRKYGERWDILIQNGFDPRLHLKRDHQGLWQLEEDRIGLRDGIRAYMRGRNEDSVDE